jgi:hypothetical protein
VLGGDARIVDEAGCNPKVSADLVKKTRMGLYVSYVRLIIASTGWHHVWTSLAVLPANGRDTVSSL